MSLQLRMIQMIQNTRLQLRQSLRSFHFRYLIFMYFPVCKFPFLLICMEFPENTLIIKILKFTEKCIESAPVCVSGADLFFLSQNQPHWPK